MGVPTYLVFLIDKTGYGPAITVGYKSNLDPEKAILGSIEESLISRVAKRYNVHNKVKITKSPTMSRYLQHLLQQQLLPYIRKSATYREKSKELDHISQLLSRLGFEAYFADITQDSFRDLGHFTYKVIIPKLQPYLPRFYKEYKHDRLRAVAHFFGYTKSPTLSQLPYPFL